MDDPTIWLAAGSLVAVAGFFLCWHMYGHRVASRREEASRADFEERRADIEVRRTESIARDAREEATRAHAIEVVRARFAVQEEAIGAHFLEKPEHVKILARIERRTTYQDEFGEWKCERWYSELDDYIEDKMRLGFKPESKQVSLVLRKLWEAEPASASTFDDTEDVRDWSEFELRCAVAYRSNGYEVELTGGTGDQGADLIVSRDGARRVVQCKMYSKPVGNHAVQEVAAARSFFDCDGADVVGMSGFTPSARMLASKLHVRLIDLTEIA